jgi:4'-phosphopantetheinyl transferase
VSVASTGAIFYKLTVVIWLQLLERIGSMALRGSIQPPSLQSLAHGHEVHVWLVMTNQLTDERRLASYDALMNPAERERNGRFVFPSGRREHLVTRALIRTTLSHYHPAIDPQDWRFSTNAFGRPEVSGPTCEPRLRFNLSHTDGLIACAVVIGREVGIDVENVARRQLDGEDIADQVFSATELAELRALPLSAQPDRFFDYWTLKEAYIKARGLGLQLPLDQFSFHLRDGVPIRISFGPRISDDPTRWQFDLQRLTPHHRLALALSRHHEPDLAVRIWPIVPGEAMEC